VKVSELVTLLSEMKQDADVCFDTEAQTYDVHLVSVDEVWPIPAEAIGREAVCLYEDHPHRCDSRAARISQLEAQLGEREAECVAHDEMNGVLAAILGNDDTLDEVAFRMLTRAESAEAALAAAREENERLRVEMEQHMQVAASRCSRLLDTEAALAAAREENERHRAEFLWPADDGSIEAIGYEFANAKTEEYRHEMWNTLLAALKSRSDDAGRVERVRETLALMYPAWDSRVVDRTARSVLAAADREGE
jgi:hypothetical protein